MSEIVPRTHFIWVYIIHTSIMVLKSAYIRQNRGQCSWIDLQNMEPAINNLVITLEIVSFEILSSHQYCNHPVQPMEYPQTRRY